MHKKHKVTLIPLSPKEICNDHIALKLKREKEAKKERYKTTMHANE
jgi:hypothetical protein